ncbi:hypothetical protein PGB34_04185 [Xenophilus arseniciresistens]|uniref:DUF4124 domain-containing protein n=1 Tax=Xenophilus arseniciresistens TaxID=1283306 RepID=A0AAE3SZ70_9BURK|nr:hypothetical protein [Xenophilus arseniciresistens]MDA7415551.1 hypothetical protein [Xenophilus arseniciresistens]
MHAIRSAQRRRALRSFIVCLALPALAPLAVQAQQPASPIWRCGNQYSDQPCPSGRAIAPDEAPSARARAEADASTQRTRQQADAMARERERQEAAAATRGPAVIEHRSPWVADDEAKAAPLQQRLRRPKVEKGRLPKNEGFTARGPAPAKGRKAH